MALGAGAITVQRVGTGGALTPVGFTLDLSGSTGGQTVARLNFTGSQTAFGSLVDGRYQIAVDRRLVLDSGGRAMAADYSANFHRYFGDVNGDARIDIADFGVFSLGYGTQSGQANYVGYLDFNGDGRIDIADFGQFALRFFTTLP